MEPIAHNTLLNGCLIEDAQFPLCQFPLRTARLTNLHAARGGEQTKRPPGNRATSSFSRENSSNRGFQIPSKLSAEILWAEKGGCQAIFVK
jgi:hypothetical protein